MDNRVPSNSKNVTFANQDVNQKQLAENSGEFVKKKVRSKNPIKLLMNLLVKFKDFILKTIHDRQIKSYNQALVKARKNNDFEKNCNKSTFDMDWYDKLNKRMDRAGFDKGLLKEKDSREIANVLLDHGIITMDDAKDLLKNDVDLEGSPYW